MSQMSPSLTGLIWDNLLLQQNFKHIIIFKWYHMPLCFLHIRTRLYSLLMPCLKYKMDFLWNKQLCETRFFAGSEDLISVHYNQTLLYSYRLYLQSAWVKLGSVHTAEWGCRPTDEMQISFNKDITRFMKYLYLILSLSCFVCTGHTYSLREFNEAQFTQLSEVAGRLMEFRDLVKEVVRSACRTALLEAGFTPDDYFYDGAESPGIYLRKFFSLLNECKSQTEWSKSC